MPLVNVEYDDSKVSDEDIKVMSEAVCGVVVKATGIEDVFVYANSARVKFNIAPIEVFVQITDKAITDETVLMNEIKVGIKKWKEQNNFIHPINLTLIPMNWKFEIGI